ncbi:unnamed protein product [Brachionus calyciflorus]|uniref:EF-hand domain-containing protein n=1 Tax=Brachionus calyciflorus TaxID=104777 RepID=A0A813RL13_9BILA|nr:unnamed protein product [Brachionus calyciflorus]
MEKPIRLKKQRNKTLVLDHKTDLDSDSSNSSSIFNTLIYSSIFHKPVSSKIAIKSETPVRKIEIPKDKFNNSQIEELSAAFNFFDFDQDKTLNKNDVSKVLRLIDPKSTKPENVQDFSLAIRKNGGSIEFEDFKAYYSDIYNGKYSKIELKHAFNVLDRNSNGFIDMEDLKIIFEAVLDKERYNLSKILAKMDFNKDGNVCFEDFKILMNGTPTN